MNYFRQRTLSPTAANLVQFDADSIRRLGDPDIWLADPDQYERDGRPLRDSESPRMLAYSTKDHILYATDGCNSCSRNVTLPADNLKQLADDNDVRLDLLQHLVKLI